MKKYVIWAIGVVIFSISLTWVVEASIQHPFIGVSATEYQEAQSKWVARGAIEYQMTVEHAGVMNLDPSRPISGEKWDLLVSRSSNEEKVIRQTYMQSAPDVFIWADATASQLKALTVRGLFDIVGQILKRTSTGMIQDKDERGQPITWAVSYDPGDGHPTRILGYSLGDLPGETRHTDIEITVDSLRIVK